MNSKILNQEEKKIKIDNLKNRTLSDIISQTILLKNFKENKEIQFQHFNLKSKYNFTKLSEIKSSKSNLNDDNIILNIANKYKKAKVNNKTIKTKKFSVEPLMDRPVKLQSNIFNKSKRKKICFSAPKFYPKSQKFIILLTNNNSESNNDKKKNKKYKNKNRLNTLNKTKKEQLDLFKKVISKESKQILFDDNIPLLSIDKIKLKKNKFKNNKKNNLNKTDNILNNISSNNIINKNNTFINNINGSNNSNSKNEYTIIPSSKPHCLYKGPLNFDIHGGEDEVNVHNSQSLFRAFMSRNLKTTRGDINANNLIDKNNNKESQAMTFQVEFDNDGTMRTKRIFNSTFNNNYYDTSIIFDNNNNDNENKNKKSGKKSNKRSFGGIMLSNQFKMF